MTPSAPTRAPAGRTDGAATSMSLVEHLGELRGRLVRAVLALAVGVVIGWSFHEQLLAWLLRPLEVASWCHAAHCDTRAMMRFMARADLFAAAKAAAAPVPPPTLHFANPVDAFVAYFRLSVIAGVVFASPVVFYQLWAFIAPGLYSREKRMIMPFVVFSTAFFLAGALFGYYLVFPFGYQWFLGFSGQIQGSATIVQPTIMMDEYLSFTSQMLLAFGLVFELPLLVFFLALAGIVTPQQLLQFSRYFIVLAFVLAAVLTPSTDWYSQVMLAMPLVVLYYVAIGLAYLVRAGSSGSARLPDNGAARPPSTG